MPATYAVIGSGPSGANAALTLLERGKTVALYDVGVEETEIPHPQSSFEELKGVLSDPAGYFLGDNLPGVIPPHSAIFDYPPSRNFRVGPDGPLLKFESNGFKPVISHNRGGLGVAWGANSLPYGDDDMKGWPLSSSDLAEGYRIAEQRMHVSDALNLNVHDALLWGSYQKKKAGLERDYRIVMHRSRMAVDTRPDSASQCVYCDRCLWGCGSGSIYNPKSTLEECKRYANFTYRPQAYVTHFSTENGRVKAVGYYGVREKTRTEEPVDRVFLAAGALSSGGIFLRTLNRDPKMKTTVWKTKSLLDTQVIKMPYVLLKMIGRSNNERDFQFNKLILGYLNESHEEFPKYIHAEVLSLTSLLYHPLIESLPFGSLFSSKLFLRLKSALGIVTFFAPDVPYGDNGVALDPDPASVTGDRLTFVYKNSSSKDRLMEDAARSVKKAFRKMGGWISDRDSLRPPAGSGIHYAGTIPMSSVEDVLCVDKTGASYAYPNLYVVDGAAFPTLPSKSITMSLVANAIRVAKAA